MQTGRDNQRSGGRFAEDIRRHEVSRTLGRIDLQPEYRRIVEQFSHSLVSSLLTGPISQVEPLLLERGRVG